MTDLEKSAPAAPPAVVKPGWSKAHALTCAGDAQWMAAKTSEADKKSKFVWARRLSNKSWFGDTPAHLAALKGDTALLQELVKGGADMDRPNSFGHRPIHMAAAAGKPDAVQFLIHKADCDPSGKAYPSQHPSPLECAHGDEILKILESAIAQKAAAQAQGKSSSPVAAAPSRLRGLMKRAATISKLNVDSAAVKEEKRRKGALGDDKAKLSSAAYYLLSMFHNSEEEHPMAAMGLSVRAFRGWKVYSSGEKQMDRLLVRVRTTLCSASAVTEEEKSVPAGVESVLLGSRLQNLSNPNPSMLVQYSKHSKRKNQGCPRLQPMLPARASVLINVAQSFTGHLSPSKALERGNKHDRLLTAYNSVLEPLLAGDLSHCAAREWSKAFIRLLKQLVETVSRLAKRDHPALRVPPPRSKKTRLQLLRAALYSLLKRLLVPGPTMACGLRPPWAIGIEGLECMTAPKGFPGRPGSLELYSKRFPHLWSWMTALGTISYPPRISSLAHEQGEGPNIPPDYDVFLWLEAAAQTVSLPSTDIILTYMLNRASFIPTLQPTQCIPGVVGSASSNSVQNSGGETAVWYYVQRLDLPMPPNTGNTEKSAYFMDVTGHVDWGSVSHQEMINIVYPEPEIALNAGEDDVDTSSHADSTIDSKRRARGSRSRTARISSSGATRKSATSMRTGPLHQPKSPQNGITALPLVQSPAGAVTTSQGADGRMRNSNDKTYMSNSTHGSMMWTADDASYSSQADLMAQAWASMLKQEQQHE